MRAVPSTSVSRTAPTADEQREGEGGAGGHPQEGDLNAVGVLRQEHDQRDGDEGGDAEGYPGRAGARAGYGPESGSGSAM